MGDFPYLEWLCRVYIGKAEKSNHWADYLKAHGLANACVTRDSREERLRQVYDVELSWYKGIHPLTFTEHQVLTNHHKRLLREYRERTKKNFDSLRPLQEALDIEDMFSDENVSNAHRFSDGVFSASRDCTEGFIAFTRQVIKSSVDIQSKVRGEVPCGFSVIGLGSVARGEATPYSDLEYAFIIEDQSHVEYFKALAVDTYFRIDNLGETPLKYFDLEEQKCKAEESGLVFSSSMIGYRIDGITQKAGNIPSGNMHGKPELILTVEGLMDLYKRTLLHPLDREVDFSDFSDIISNSVAIFSNKEGDKLHETFLQTRMTYEAEEIRQSQFVREKRTSRFAYDIDTYCFLPEVDPFDPPQNFGIVVKEDIFRYPTLLAMYLKSALILNTNYPWETYTELRKTNTDCQYLSIVLAISIYIRTTAYLTQGTQSELLSVYSSTSSGTSDRYYVPNNLFVTLCYLLVPIKSSIQSSLCRSEENISEANGLVKELAIPKDDFMLHSEVLCFVCNSTKALNYLYKAVGEQAVNECAAFILKTSGEFGDSKDKLTERKYLRVCCALLSESAHPEYAISYIIVLESHEPCEVKKLRWKLLMVDCMNKSFQFRRSLNLLEEVKQQLVDILGINVFDYSLREATSQNVLIEKKLALISVELFTVTAKYCEGQGCISESLQLLRQSLENFQLARRLWEILLKGNQLDKDQKLLVKHYISRSLKQLSMAFTSNGQYVRSLELCNELLKIQRDIYGKDTNHPDVAASFINLANITQSRTGRTDRILAHQAFDMYKSVYGDFDHPGIASSHDSIGCVHYSMGQYTEALDSFTKALTMKKAVYGENADHPHIATSYIKAGDVYIAIGEYTVALDNYRKSLVIEKTLYGEDAEHLDIASNYNSIGDVYKAMGEYTAALDFYTKSLAIEKAVYGEDITHANIATSYSNIGDVYREKGDHAAALEYCTKSLSMWKVVYGEGANHPHIANSYNSIGDVHYAMGEYSSALESFTKSLAMAKAVYGENGSHPNIAFCYNCISRVYKETGEYMNALDYLAKSLDMLKIVYGEHADHPDIAENYNNTGNVHKAMGEYATALKYHLKSLAVRKAVYGEDTNHSKIAATYNNIANAYSPLGDYKAAIDYYMKSLAMRKAIHGQDANHPRITFLYNNIGEMYRDIGEYTSAIEYLTKSLEMMEIVYGKDKNHPYIAISCSNIGEAHNSVGEHAIALRYHMKALEIQKAVHGKDSNHPKIAISYNRIGEVYSAIGDHELALEYYRKSLAMSQAIHGKYRSHPHIATSYDNMGRTYYAMREYKLALQHHTKSLDMMKTSYGEDANQLAIATCYSNMADVYKAMREFASALEHYSKSLVMMKIVHGEDVKKPAIAKNYSNIGEVYTAMGEYTTAQEYYTKALAARNTT